LFFSPALPSAPLATPNLLRKTSLCVLHRVSLACFLPVHASIDMAVRENALHFLEDGIDCWMTIGKERRVMPLYQPKHDTKHASAFVESEAGQPFSVRLAVCEKSSFYMKHLHRQQVWFHHKSKHALELRLFCDGEEMDNCLLKPGIDDFINTRYYGAGVAKALVFAE
jgi:hypothetical protein